MGEDANQRLESLTHQLAASEQRALEFERQVAGLTAKLDTVTKLSQQYVDDLATMTHERDVILKEKAGWVNSWDTLNKGLHEANRKLAAMTQEREFITAHIKSLHWNAIANRAHALGPHDPGPPPMQGTEWTRNICQQLTEWSQAELAASKQRVALLQQTLSDHVESYSMLEQRQITTQQQLAVAQATIAKRQFSIEYLSEQHTLQANRAVQLQATVTAQAEEIKRLRDPLLLMLQDSEQRVGIRDGCDGVIKDLCELYGYGAVMDSAARQWRKKDAVGAFLIGPCIGTVEQALAAKETR